MCRIIAIQQMTPSITVCDNSQNHTLYMGCAKLYVIRMYAHSSRRIHRACIRAMHRYSAQNIFTMGKNTMFINGYSGTIPLRAEVALLHCWMYRREKMQCSAVGVPKQFRCAMCWHCGTAALLVLLHCWLCRWKNIPCSAVCVPKQFRFAMCWHCCTAAMLLWCTAGCIVRKTRGGNDHSHGAVEPVQTALTAWGLWYSTKKHIHNMSTYYMHTFPITVCFKLMTCRFRLLHTCCLVEDCSRCKFAGCNSAAFSTTYLTFHLTVLSHAAVAVTTSSK